MKTCVEQIKISEIVDGYQVRGDDSLIGWGGKLSITHSCQHEYIRSGDAKWQVPLIHSVYPGHLISLIYFAEETPDFCNILDGQQRLRTICDFVKDNCLVSKLNKVSVNFG